MRTRNNSTNERGIELASECLTEREMPHPILARQPYSPPHVNVTKPSIRGGNTTDVPESQGGLWTS